MKKRILCAIALIFCLIIQFPAYAANTRDADIVVSLQIGNPIMTINGTAAEIDRGVGTKPLIRNGRTIVPVRAIIEAFGGSVSWDDKTRTVYLSLNGDSIRLVIGSYSAYLNNTRHTLDTAPIIINGRTLLPIRFIAEGFNLGVAWDNSTRTVSIITNGFDSQEYEKLMSVLPKYSGNPYAVLNGNIPFFKKYEIIDGSFEYYSSLDGLGRCNVCMASVGRDIMPTGERESISSVKPTGWHSAFYDFIPGDYLYNRCHLLGFQLTGENANAKNLITGTRYLNIEGMLPFENMIDDYVDSTGNHVLYRATPVFTGGNLVADGVLLEAYSVEDNGAGISLCVYCYNVQPGVIINYATGASSSSHTSDSDSSSPANTYTVYRTPSGKRYHLDPDCGGKNSYSVSLTEAKFAGLTPCLKCAA